MLLYHLSTSQFMPTSCICNDNKFSCISFLYNAKSKQTAWFIRSQCEPEIRVSITDGCFSFTSIHQYLVSREIALPAALASGFIFPFTVHSVICINSVLGKAICGGLHITPNEDPSENDKSQRYSVPTNVFRFLVCSRISSMKPLTY